MDTSLKPGERPPLNSGHEGIMAAQGLCWHNGGSHKPVYAGSIPAPATNSASSYRAAPPPESKSSLPAPADTSRLGRTGYFGSNRTSL